MVSHLTKSGSGQHTANTHTHISKAVKLKSFLKAQNTQEIGSAREPLQDFTSSLRLLGQII